MDRRAFAKTAFLGATAVILPSAASAASADPDKNVLFTQTDPGHWASVESLHVPLTTIVDGKLTIRTPHPHSEAHYIVSHTVVLANGVFLSRKTFSYRDDPVSEHMLPPGYRGPVVVTSTCNLHDTWAKTITA
jgi:superoxide reductase